MKINRPFFKPDDDLSFSNITESVIDIFNEPAEEAPPVVEEAPPVEEEPVETVDEVPPVVEEAPPVEIVETPPVISEELTQKLEEMQNNILNSMKQKEEPQEEPKEELTDDELREQLIEKIISDPETAIRDIMGKREEEVRKQVEAEANERDKYQKLAEDFANTHEDYPNYYDKMVEIINDNPFLQNTEKAFEVAYNMAKGMAYQEPVSFDDMLKDESNIQSLLANKDIESKFVERYLKNRVKGQPPLTINASSGGETALTPPSEPKNWSDVTKQVAQLLQQ